jgi:hypothetical protein
MLDERYPNAIKVRLVLDNLNTHDIASLYETFAPDEARRVVERLEIHHTPKHGSWLNMAAIELSVLKGPVVRSPDCRHGNHADSSGGMGSRTEQQHKKDRVAVHHNGRSDQVEASLSDKLNATRY